MNFLRKIKDFASIRKEDNKEKAIIGNAIKTKNGLKCKLIIIGVIAGTFMLFLLIVVLLIELGILDDNFLDSSDAAYLAKTYKECESVIVNGTAYTLDEYIAGVVSGEAYTDQNIEALKAQAVAARTYAINGGVCNSSATSSDSFQVFNESINEKAIQAASETSGLVLTYNGKIFSTQYDSYCYQDADCPNSTCNDTNCSVTYTRLPNGETHTISIPVSYKNMFVPGGGHARGMSQLVSYYMADNGASYEDILKYFYSDGVEITNIALAGEYGEGTQSGDISKFIKRTFEPESDNTYYYSDSNVSYSTGNVGQCTWYAFGRANELLANADSGLKWQYAPNAKDWYSMNAGDGVNGFKSSKDVNFPQVGAIIVWSSNEFGHVAVVEAVNNDGTIDYSEANISSSKSETNPYGWRYQSNIPYINTGLGSISEVWGGYSFEGYIYILD